MNTNEQTATMYETIPAVAELNKVPGFNPVKLLRRIVSPESGKEMMHLDLRYKKLWFRLANPKGRIRLNALRVTEQMAIYEAQVFLDRADENPIGSFTSSCTKEEAPGERYIQMAQQAAMDEALSDAGFGIQFADVAMEAEGSRYGGRIPMNESVRNNKEAAVPKGTDVVSAGQEQTAAVPAGDVVRTFPTAVEKKCEPPQEKPVQAVKVREDEESNSLPAGPQANAAEEAPKPVTEELPVKAAEAESLPIQADVETPQQEKEGNILPVSEKMTAGEDTRKAVQGMMALLGGQNVSKDADTSPAGNAESRENTGVNSPAAEIQDLPASGEPAKEKTAARYTSDMPVEEIAKLMTIEEAGQVVVDTGVCKGQTIAQVAERRPPSLKFYLYGGYRGDNNILRAAAQVMLDSMAEKKAG